MPKITLIVVVALCMSVAFVLILIWRSRQGEEDKNGFHPGMGDKLTDAQTNNESKIQQQNLVSSGSATPIAAKR
jgi:hypothetical protein